MPEPMNKYGKQEKKNEKRWAEAVGAMVKCYVLCDQLRSDQAWCGTGLAMNISLARRLSRLALEEYYGSLLPSILKQASAEMLRNERTKPH